MRKSARKSARTTSKRTFPALFTRYYLMQTSSIEASAKSLNQPYIPNHPVIQRVLEAHARDVSTILPPAARSLFPLPDIPATPWRPNGHQLAQESALCQAGSTQEGSGATAPPSPRSEFRPKPASRATGASRGVSRAALSRSTTSAPKPAQATPRPLYVG